MGGGFGKFRGRGQAKLTLGCQLGYLDPMDLSELVIPAAIGSGGTLLGVLATNRHTVRLARLNHDYTRIGAERVRLEETAQVLERWTNSMITVFPFYYRAQISDLLEFVETDSGRKNREDAERLKNLLTAGKVNSTSADVQAAYQKLASLWSEFTDNSIHALTLKKEGHTPESSYVDALEFRENFTEIIDHIAILLNTTRTSWIRECLGKLRLVMRRKKASPPEFE
ncbi:hypothetical protein AA310_05745 [Arthrobacter sp. YC-RL1]|nr:hypothetical protein ATC04_12140 [Arthrobacter sp. YC-RL1]KLI87510.1 hypothetical protein AA310_05745 [Arthrobacter sp. YC-RL1]